MNCIMYNGTAIEYTLTRKKVKNINLRIRADGSVCVSAPRSVPLRTIEAFLHKNALKILSAKARFAAMADREPKFTNGEEVSLLGEKYRLEVIRSDTNSYTVTGSDIVFRISDEAQSCQLYEKLLRDTAKEFFPALVNECLPLFPLKKDDPPVIKIRKMKAQWGNCRAAKNTVTLNTRLAAYDPQVIKYVICHELCHFTYQDHSKAFYSLLSSVLPDWKKYDAVLKNKF